MTCIALVQARMSSSRLPGKVLEKLGDVPAIVYLVGRARLARRISRVVVVTSTDATDDPLVETLERYGIDCFRGPLEDVLARYVAAARLHPADSYVRLTGDCPLLDPLVVDAVVGAREAAGVEYASNIDPPTYPDGLDCECFSAEALELCHAQARSKPEREHVTLWMREERSGLRRVNVSLPIDAAGTRLTVDYPDDLAAVRRVLALLPVGQPYDSYDLLKVVAMHPELRALNPHLRNEAIVAPSPRPAADFSTE